jgi:hypothetical protein
VIPLELPFRGEYLKSRNRKDMKGTKDRKNTGCNGG